jgi:hypothetical protein
MAVGVPEVIDCQDTLHNNGPEGPVDSVVTSTATAPPGCAIMPTSSSSPVSLPVSVVEGRSEQYAIHCSEPDPDRRPPAR